MSHDEGRTLRERAQGRKAPLLQDALVDLDPKVGEWSDGFVFGEAWDGDEMAFEERMIVAITALAATGRITQLRNYLHGALQAGMEPDRIRAGLRMLVVYVGFPGAISALQEFASVVLVHEKAGR
ncbi:carboxymuconolactone decarboxylase family protein [Rhodococcus sp. Eu-32]|uniref:carboxymuconolactone decarboxylase family protein n=1 Tax=Rhodococcus sp. Eu-32 TaxID=1017319 RepID=UPI000DF305FC|nr:carboxymuconolactone decarboxylase family protein [Rhodococcus sp. Eu-32]RRQ29002.1 carboxymuconolactone decarboxylase family protein [Rhodococcus sp. Eu-32]